MAGLANVLYPQAETAQVPEAAFWKAWHPEVPYTGSLAQQQELVRLRDMQDKNMAGTLVLAALPETSQGAVANQNAQVMQAPIQNGQMAPLQAVAPVAPIPAVPDMAAAMQSGQAVPAALQPQQVPRAPQMMPPIPVNGGVPASESLAQILQPQPQAAPQPVQSAIDKGLQPPAPVEDRTAAPAQSQQFDVATALTSPETPPQSKWRLMLDQMKKPEVVGPLQTFFSALSAPLAPWETMGSRLGRANMLMQMHKGMLADNLKDIPRQDQLKDLAVRGKTAEVTTAEVKASVAEATKDTVIAKAMADLEKARLDNNAQEIENATSLMKQRLIKLYGDEKAAADIFAILSDVKYKQGTLAEQQKRTQILADKPTKSVKDMTPTEAGQYVNALRESFYGSGASKRYKDELEWINEMSGDKGVQEFQAAMAKSGAKFAPAPSAGGNNDPLGLRK